MVPLWILHPIKDTSLVRKMQMQWNKVLIFFLLQALTGVDLSGVVSKIPGAQLPSSSNVWEKFKKLNFGAYMSQQTNHRFAIDHFMQPSLSYMKRNKYFFQFFAFICLEIQTMYKLCSILPMSLSRWKKENNIWK